MAEYEIKEGVGIIPAGSTEIKDEAFKGCEELKSVVIPDTVTKIGNHAFRWCSALTEINIPDSVTEIGRGAFAGCISLKNLVLPDSVTEIGSDVRHRRHPHQFRGELLRRAPYPEGKRAAVGTFLRRVR